MSQITFTKRGSSVSVIAKEDGTFVTQDGEKVPAKNVREAIKWLKNQEEKKKEK